MRTLAFVSALLAAPLAAQGLLVVPAAHANSDAPSMLGAAGVGVTERQQILIDGGHLAPLVGRRITGIAFRRDTGFDESLQNAQGNVTIRAGISPNAADAPSASFASNLPNATECYIGGIQAPASPSTTSRTVGWTVPDVVEVTFHTAIPYTGGTLCLEIDGVGAPVSWWPVDATEDTVVGTVTPDGAACGPRAAVLGQTAYVAAADLVVGRTALCKLFGEPGSPAFLLVGADVMSSPMDLTLVGAPGCWLHVAPISAIPSQVSPPLPVGLFGGVANVNLHLPSQSALIGAAFALQWVELLPGSLATSNGLRCTVGPARPSLGAAVVWQRPGGQVVIDTSRVPVLGLRWE